MRFLLIIILLGISETALAASYTPKRSWRLLELRKFSMDAWRTADHRDSYMQYDDPDDSDRGEYWVGGAAANFDLDLVRYGSYGLYWDNSVPMYGTNSQVREVGWRWELGVKLGDHFQVWHRHESRHVLDAQRDEKYPLSNDYGMTITFHRGMPW
jgi:hypothetical protein